MEELSKERITEVQELTENNDHFEARIRLAALSGEGKLARCYISAKILHFEYNNPFALKLRRQMDLDLKNHLQEKYSNFNKIWMAL